MTTQIMTVGGKRCIVEKPQSKCGYTYPRIFIEEKPQEAYINFDVYLGHCFKMERKDWDDWAKDSIEIKNAQLIRDVLHEIGINYDRFKEALEVL